MTRDRSFQKEIPPSRVNIRYVKYTGGAQEQVELPLKLLLLGDYTGRPDATPLEERKKISVNKDNFDGRDARAGAPPEHGGAEPPLRGRKATRCGST